MINIISIICNNTNYLMQFTTKIGHHISKSQKTIYGSLKDGYKDGNYEKPVQMFLHVPQSGRKMNISDNDLTSCHKYIQVNNLHYYIHAPYIINLSNPYNSKSTTNKDDEPRGLKILREDLELTKAFGGKGVVVHVGKSVGKPEKEALDLMYQSIQTVLQYSSPECPLILETPAHQGTELCWTYESLKAFYDRFTEEEKTRFKICVDTCHVFAAGDDPLDYLKKWQVRDIALIHLNDSKCGKGERKDRHAFVGTGKIGLERMQEVIDYCLENKLDMIIE